MLIYIEDLMLRDVCLCTSFLGEVLCQHSNGPNAAYQQSPPDTLIDTLIMILTLGKGRERDVKNAREIDDLWVRPLSINVLAMRSICNPSLV